MVKPMPHLTNRFSVLETSTVGSTRDMLTPQSPIDEPKTEKSMPQESPRQPPDSTPILIRSSTLRRGMELPLRIHTIGSNTPLLINALIDSGATSRFINIDYIRSKNLCTQRLPRAIPVYNVDGTLNDAGYITEVVDLMVHHGDHSERATFHVTGIGRTTIILGHTWLVEHNPDIDWSTGKVSMTRCPEACGSNTNAGDTNRPKFGSVADKFGSVDYLAGNSRGSPQAKSCRKVHIKEVPEDQPGPSETEPPPGFACPDPDDLDRGDRLFVQFIGEHSEEVRATQTISQRLAEAAEGPHKTCFEDIVPKPYQEFKDVFTKESFDKLPDRKKWDHAIELIPDAQMFSTKVYPLAPVEQKQLDEFLDENLKSRCIRPSKLPMASPVFFIKKKDGSLGLVQDYRKLNALMIKNAYPLPLIPNILNTVSRAKAKYFTKLDVWWGYNNVRIKDRDEWKAAFRTNRGLFEPLVMFFGLTNSLVTFQTIMNDIFRELIDEGVVVIYMDDILIFGGQTKEEHHAIVVRVLDILCRHRLNLKAEKCTFGQPTVEYLGLILSEGRVEMDPVKVASVRDWPTPRNVTEVQSFVGFVNFYRRLIQDFSHVAKPLHQLTKKGVAWKWTKDEKKAFEELKWLITLTPILVQPNWNAQFQLEIDTYGYTMGAVLSYLCEDDKWHPVGFTSKILSSTERNYKIHEKELLSVIQCLEEWRHILEGTKHTIEVLNDHRNLTYFRESQNLNRRQACWSLFLSRFDFSLIHRPGQHSAKPDALSRRKDHLTKEGDNQDQVMLSAERFDKLSELNESIAVTGDDPTCVMLEGKEASFLKRVHDCTD